MIRVGLFPPTNSAEKDKLKRDCLTHATKPNGVIDWEVYELGLHGHNLFRQYW